MGRSELTVVFFPEGAFGPTNNCVGIANELKGRGTRVIFVVEASFAKTLEAQGFEERLMRLKPKPEEEEEPGQFWKDFIRDTAPQFKRPTLDQLEGLIKPIWEQLVDGAVYVDERLSEIFDEVAPDIIVQDNVVGFPAVPASGRPWVRIVSCNPLELKDPELPPVFSGYPTGDRSGWDEFRNRYRELHQELQSDFDDFCRSRGAPPLPPGEFIHESDYLNLYLYPEEADYDRSKSLSAKWQRLDSCVRTTDPSVDEDPMLREFIDGHGGELVYLSLGSLGSADVELMKRLINVLGKSKLRVIVSLGPQHKELSLADNMYGREFLPQTSILPEVDVVITHGGNNTVTESFHFGKPMIVLPLFWDQYDNAQRVHELGFGIRLDPYRFEDEELTKSIDRLLADRELGRRMASLSRRLQATPGARRAADLIEMAARSPAPV